MSSTSVSHLESLQYRPQENKYNISDGGLKIAHADYYIINLSVFFLIYLKWSDLNTEEIILCLVHGDTTSVKQQE